MTPTSAKPLSRKWKIFLLIAILAGAILRLAFTHDMEWKEDEYYDFAQTLLIGHTQPWPWVGMNSGVFLPNPGMSIWVFVWLARIAHATDPIALQRALSFLAIFGIALLIPFAIFFVKRGDHPNRDDREPWFWAAALAAVNPFGVYIDRKLWPEGFFPFFSTLFLMGWWKRDLWWGALLWGFIGALLGQIHMSGFFFAFAVFLWTLLFSSRAIPRRAVQWRYWFVGSCLGAWPLIPWAYQAFTTRLAGPVLSGTWGEALQLKFWVFWITDPLGLHLGNPLGIHLGGSLYAQISDFIRYPLIDGHATYLCGAAHLLALVTGVWIIFGGLIRRGKQLLTRSAVLPWLFARKVGQGPFVQKSAFWGFGAILTLTRVNIRRYYMRVAFPLQEFWLVRMALSHSPNPKKGRLLLGLLWFAQLLISAFFVGYIHVNNGSTNGDYGQAYHVIEERHRVQLGESWPDLKFLKIPKSDR